ncbi:MAG: 50S ribosomal protein L22 [Candidatus Omnitrophota bacterium]
MIAKAEVKFIRISPSKIRQVIDLIRHKDARQAQDILSLLNKRPKEFLAKLLKSAIANAKVKGFSVDRLFVSKIICNPGPAWKRYKAAAFGRAAPIKKRTSHIRIELDLKQGA